MQDAQQYREAASARRARESLAGDAAAAKPVTAAARSEADAGLTDEQLALRELEAEWKKAAKPVALNPVIPTTANIVTSDDEAVGDIAEGVEDEGVTEGDLETVARVASARMAASAKLDRQRAAAEAGEDYISEDDDEDADGEDDGDDDATGSGQSKLGKPDLVID